LIYRKSGNLVVKETMAITMIDPEEVKLKEFEESHVYAKLRKMVVVARVFDSEQETKSIVHSVGQFDLDDPQALAIIKADYDLVRSTLYAKGFNELTGEMGKLIQPRTKGSGHGSVSRAFYARTQFVAHILGLSR